MSNLNATQVSLGYFSLNIGLLRVMYTYWGGNSDRLGNYVKLFFASLLAKGLLLKKRICCQWEHNLLPLGANSAPVGSKFFSFRVQCAG